VSDAFDLPGGPAFPISLPGVGDNGCPGMSLRDWFAGMCLSRMISLCEDRNGGWEPSTVAVNAYALADAMIAERRGQAVATNEQSPS